MTFEKFKTTFLSYVIPSEARNLVMKAFSGESTSGMSYIEL
jgi:hypothetical protein